MLITILSTVGLLSLATSFIMFGAQILTVDFISKEKRKEYILVSKIPKSSRSKEEQEMIDETWHSYYMLKVRNIGFTIGIVLFPMAILLNT